MNENTSVVSVISNKGRQIFAFRLDEKILHILKIKCRDIISSYFYPQDIFNLSLQFQPEIEAISLGLYYSYLTFIDTNKSTPGMMTMGLSINNSYDTKWKQKVKLCSIITIYWGFLRLKRKSDVEGWRHKTDFRKEIWKSLQITEFIYQLFSSSNYLLFLLYGKFPCLFYRFMNFQVCDKRQNNTNSYGDVLTPYWQRHQIWEALYNAGAAFLLISNWKESIYLYKKMTQQCVKIKNFVIKKLYPKTEFSDTTFISNVFNCEVTNGRIMSNLPTKCCKCKCLPAETPHFLQSCGHVFCYLHIPEDILSNDSQEDSHSYYCSICDKTSRKVMRVEYG